MKKLLLIVVLMGCSVFMAQAQSKSVSALYEKYKGDDDFFHLDLSGSFFDFAEGFDIDFDEEGLKAITKSVEKMKLFKLPVGEEIAKKDFRSLQKGLQKERYDLMMEVTEKESEMAFYAKGGDVISDLVLLIGGGQGQGCLVVELEGTFESRAIAKVME